MDKGGFDVNGAWHDPGDGKFAKKGMSTAKAAVLALVRGVLAAGHAKRNPDGIDLKLRRPAGVHKPGDTLRARYHSDTHATVDMDGRPALVRWDTFEEPDPILNPVRPVADTPVTQDMVAPDPEDWWNRIPPVPEQLAVAAHQAVFNDVLKTADADSPEFDAAYVAMQDATNALRDAQDGREARIVKAISLGKLTTDDADRLYAPDGNEPTSGYSWAKNLRTDHAYDPDNPWQPLPETLFHVTTSRTGVEASGLKTRNELGQGSSGHGLGGGSADTISFTTDPVLAEVIADTMHEAIDALNGNITFADMIERARVGDRGSTPFLDDLLESVGPSHIGSTPLDEFVTEVAPGGKQDTKRKRWDLFTRFLTSRARAGGPPDPVFWQTDIEALSAKHHDDIAVVSARPVDNALGIPLSGMAEWRVPTGEAVTVTGINAVAPSLPEPVGFRSGDNVKIGTDIPERDIAALGIGTQFKVPQITGREDAVYTVRRGNVEVDLGDGRTETIPLDSDWWDKYKTVEIVSVSGVAAPDAPSTQDLVEAPERVEPPRTVSVPDHVVDAANRAISDLTDIYVEDVGGNAALLDTIPTIPSHVGELSPAAQLVALDWLFHPENPPAPLGGLPVLDATHATNTGARPKLGMVAVNPDTGAIIGTFAPWDEEGSMLPPYGEWVSLPADHPAAARLVTAAWLATPAVKRHIVGNVYEPGLLHRMRSGETIDDPAFPGLVDAYRGRSDSLIEGLSGVVTLDKHTDADGTWFTPSVNGGHSADVTDIRFADSDEAGGTRLWVDPAGVTSPDDGGVFAALDYTDADNTDATFDDRVKALKAVHVELKGILSGTPDDWLTVPHQTDVDALIEGHGGEQELARVAAVERFGKSVSGLIDTRLATMGAQVDKQPVMDTLSRIEGIPAGLLSLLETEQWTEPYRVHVPGTKRQPGGGGHTVIRFADRPDSSIVILTPADGTPARVAWAFPPTDRGTLGESRFEGWDPNDTITANIDIPNTFHSRRARPRVDHAEPSPTLLAFTETMEALGIDMGVDPDIYIGSGRNRAAEAAFYGAVDANPTKLSDLDPDSELYETATIGLAPFPKAWTSQVRRKLQRLSIDPDRNQPVGAATRFSDANVIDLPSIVVHPEFKDVITHEFTHSMEHTVVGLITAETWHFIQRLRKEHTETGTNKRWDWGNGQNGYADEFGDEYMGRLYSPDITNQKLGHEILSTAAQQLHGHTNRSRFGMDKPARDFLIGLMAIVDPDPPEDLWNP